MDNVPLTMAQRLAEVASVMQQQRTGCTPEAVTVVLSENTVVVTLHEALTPAEKALSKSPAGAAQVQEFHRQLFSNSCHQLKDEIRRITGRRVREAAAEIEPSTGGVVHAFTTGAMVQVFLLAQPDLKTARTARNVGGKANSVQSESKLSTDAPSAESLKTEPKGTVTAESKGLSTTHPTQVRRARRRGDSKAKQRTSPRTRSTPGRPRRHEGDDGEERRTPLWRVRSPTQSPLWRNTQ